MRKSSATLCAAVSLAAAWSAAAAQANATIAAAPTPPSRAVLAARVDSLAHAFITEPQAPGVSIAVIRAGRDTLVFEGYGSSAIENDVPATPATVYRIGSITKQFTAAAVLRLVERGAVRLDDSVGTYLPSLPADWKRVTVRQLLNHTSGIPSYTNLGERWKRRWGEAMPPDTIVALTADEPMDFEPGTKWRYDNTGYVLLGMLLEKVTGSSYAAYLDSTLFRPLGLNGTLYCDDGPIVPHRARGYHRDGRTFTNAEFLHMSQPFSAGALCSTVGDLARWNRALATGDVLTAASYRQMTTPEGAAVPSGYGFGLGRDTLGGHVEIEHGGGINGFITANAYFPDDSLSVTVLANAAPSDPGALLANVARAAFGLPLVQPPPAPEAVALPEKVRAAVVGSYELEMGGEKTLVTIAADSGGVMAHFGEQGDLSLLYVGDYTFGSPDYPGIRLRFVIEKGRAVRMVFSQNGKSSTGVRTH